jgi:cytoskeleton protein RodZ
MTESDSVGVGSMYTPSPGALLRRARQAQGLHIAALAAALKVTPRKLELLENDQFDQLPDVAFARALAQAVCRHLKIEAPPVLALLPTTATAQPALERVTVGLNTPFRERSERHESGEWPNWLHPRVVAPVLLLLAALAFLFVPKGWMAWVPVELPWMAAGAAGPAPGGAPAAPAPAVPVAAEAAAPVAVPAPAPASQAAAADAAVAAAPAASAASSAPGPGEPAVQAAPQRVPLPAPPLPLPGGMLAVRAAGESWLEVTDAAGDVLISRLLAPGEAVGLNGIAPLRVTIGNADGMEVRFKGRPVELEMAPDNTARLQLK